MDSSDKAFLAIIFLEVIIGFLFSFFMIIFLSAIEFQKKNMMTYIKILIPLNVSNICYTFFIALNYTIGFLWPELFTKTYVTRIITYMSLYSITSSLWLSAVLCVFYFMKIIPSQSGGVLITLKRRIDAVVWWLIIMSEVVSLGGSFLSMLIPNKPTNQRNSSITTFEMVEESRVNSKNFIIIVLILNCLPFLVIIMTTIGSAGFLKLYNHQIQKNMTTSGNTRVRDYRVAIQTMIGLLVFYVLLFLCTVFLVLNVFTYPDLGCCLCMFILFSSTTILPTLLIYGNPGLKEAIKQMFTR